VDGGALLESYEAVNGYLRGLDLGEQPVADNLIFKVASHVLDVIVESYGRREIEELDMLSLFDDALRHHGWHLDPHVVRELLQREHAAYARHLLVPEATMSTLQELRARGYALGMVSNATVPGPMMRGDLELLGLSDLISAATFSSEAGVRKPHPDIFQRTLDQLQIDPAACVFVGDRLREDVRGSRRLGMQPVLTHEFRQEHPTADEPVPVITRFAEILDVLDSLEAPPP
jgi:putative hydrolase of the HAD superfamily